MQRLELERAAERFMSLARARSQTVATAESCTAGALVNLLAETPLAGETLQGGFVVYTKDAKTSVLGVPAETLEEQTAVSAAVAEAMARGSLERSPADLSIAITGVAGPEPDEDGNPVGLVFVAAAHRDGRCRVSEHQFDATGKSEICAAAMHAGLKLATALTAAETGTR